MGTAELGPIGDRTTTHGRVYELLRRAILDGHYKPGEAVTETAVSSFLQVSRSPCREAMSRLEEEGLLERRTFKGWFIASISQQDVDEIIRLRKVLEPYATAEGLDWLCEHGQDEAALLLANLRASVIEGDRATCVDAHFELHGLLYRSTGNQMLMRMWNMWAARLRLFLAVELQNEATPLEQTRDSCERLWAAITSRDLVQINKELDIHLTAAESHPLVPSSSDSV